MNEPLEELYFNWLCSLIERDVAATPSASYNHLLVTMHNTEYVWLIVGDDNRGADGVGLRYIFITDAEIPDDPVWRAQSCSFFEMLVAISIRAEDITNESKSWWFWHLIENLGLENCTDAEQIDEDFVAQTLYDVIWRQYDYKGQGGLFPLNRSDTDQRLVEIWYQFFNYLDEKDY